MRTIDTKSVEKKSKSPCVHLIVRSEAEHTQTQIPPPHVQFSVLHRIDLQQCIDCKFSEGIDLLILEAFAMKIRCRRAEPESL